MRVRILISLMVLLLVPVFAAAQTQFHDQMRIDLPFGFIAGEQRMPAGTYIVTEREGNGIVLRSLDGKANLQFIAVPKNVDRRAAVLAEPVAKMVFRRYGTHAYFLTELSLEGAHTWALQSSPMEGEYQRAGVGVTRVVVAGK